MIAVSVEEKPDFAETARLAEEAFASPLVSFDPEHMRWLYEDSFSEGTIVVRLSEAATGKKVGQIALVRQAFMLNGVPEIAAELVDLFILKEWRGRDRLTLLFEEVERQFPANQIRLVFGMGNAKAVPINKRYLDMKPFFRLPLRAGLALPMTDDRVTTDMPFDRADAGRFVDLFDRYATADNEAGVRWTGETLLRRLCGHKHIYGIHATGDLLLVSSPRVSRGVPHTLLTGFLRRTGVMPHRADVTALTRAATRMWKRPQFVYAGFNATLPLVPGFALPERIRPSPLLLQYRDFAPERGSPDLDRFQLIDFDFA